MNRLMYDVPDARAMLGNMSRSTFYEKVKCGDIAVIKIGSRSYVAHDELARFVRDLAAAQVVT